MYDERFKHYFPCTVSEMQTFTYLYHRTEVSDVGELFTELRRVLKVPLFSRTQCRTQSNTPPSNNSLGNFEAMPLFDKTLLRVVETVDRVTIDSFMQFTHGLVYTRACFHV